MIRLLDSEWERIREHFPEENIPDGRPGRKPVPTRLVLEAVLWILNTGAQWHMLNYKTVHRRFPRRINNHRAGFDTDARVERRPARSCILAVNSASARWMESAARAARSASFSCATG